MISPGKTIYILYINNIKKLYIGREGRDKNVGTGEDGLKREFLGWRDSRLATYLCVSSADTVES